MSLSFSLSAFNEKNANGNSGGTSYGEESKSDVEPDTKSKAEVEKVEETKKTDAEPDSSYYSVNKFNFLFYFVYKMKYMDDEVVESKPEN